MSRHHNPAEPDVSTQIESAQIAFCCLMCPKQSPQDEIFFNYLQQGIEKSKGKFSLSANEDDLYYRIFLRFILTPTETIIKVFSEKVLDPVVCRNLIAYYNGRRSVIGNQLTHSIAFESWWKNVSQPDIESIINEFIIYHSDSKVANYVNINRVKEAYRLFCLSFAQDVLEKNRFDLMTLVCSLEGECASQALGAYEPLLAFHDVILKISTLFFSQTEQTDADVFEYIGSLNTIINGIQTWHFSADQTVELLFKGVIIGFKKTITLLDKYHFVSKARVNSIKEVLEHSHTHDGFIMVEGSSHVPIFPAPKIQFDYLVRDTLLWLQEMTTNTEVESLKNKGAVLTIYDRIFTLKTSAISVITHAASTVLSAEFAQQTARAVSGFFGTMSSAFFSARRSSTVSNMSNFTNNLSEIRKQMIEAQTAQQFMGAIEKLFAREFGAAQSIKDKENFLSALIQQVTREAYAKYLVCQFQETPYFLAESKELLQHPVPDEVLRDAVELFLEEEALSEKLDRLNKRIMQNERGAAPKTTTPKTTTPDDLLTEVDFKSMAPSADFSNSDLDDEPACPKGMQGRLLAL